MWSRFCDVIRDDSGATAIEYGIIALMIAVAIIVAVTQVGTDLLGIFQTLAAVF